jgi:HK97 family phage major capsid protein
MDSLELRKQRAALVAQMNEITAKGEWTPEAREKWDKINADQELLRVRIDAVELSEKLAKEMREFKAPEQAQPNVGKEIRVTRDNIHEVRGLPEYNDAFMAFCRSGRKHPLLDEIQERTALTETTTGGGYLIPTGFQKELEIKLKAIGPIRGQARIITTATGNIVNWPTWDDTANKGEWLAINSDATTSQNPTFGQVNLIANVASSKQVLVPVQLLQDSAFDLQAELSDAFAIRLGRITNDGYTTGTGTTMPNGIVPQIAAGTTVTATGDTGTGNTDLNSVGYNDLNALITALDPAYRRNARYMANQSTFDMLRKLKDTLGRPLWVSSLTQGQPDTIFGYPFFFNQSCAAIAAAAKSIVFGDFSKYIIRDVLGITFVRFNELYMGSYQVGFQAYLRTDGQCIQPAAFSVLYHPAS